MEREPWMTEKGAVGLLVRKMSVCDFFFSEQGILFYTTVGN